MLAFDVYVLTSFSASFPIDVLKGHMQNSQET